MFSTLQVYGPVFARRVGRRCVFNGLITGMRECEREGEREKRESHTHKRGGNTGSSPRGDHEGAVICVLPDTLWPPYRLIFNGSYCTAEGHFCQYSIHVCRNGQVCTVFVCQFCACLLCVRVQCFVCVFVCVLCATADTLTNVTHDMFNLCHTRTNTHTHVHLVCQHTQVKALTYGKIMSMNLNAIDFWIDQSANNII